MPSPVAAPSDIVPSPQTEFAALELFPCFGNHAVLQRNRPIRIFGRAVSGTEITVTFAGWRATCTADEHGRWEYHFPGRAAGGPFDLIVADGMTVISATDILVGDVWLCSGQSNMEWPLSDTNDAEREIGTARQPDIREFKIPPTASDTPLETPGGRWQPCAPESAGRFSAVAYYFAKFVREKVDVPIGLINSTYGGSPIEAWLSWSAFDREMHGDTLERAHTAMRLMNETDEALISAGLLDSDGVLRDAGNRGEAKGWAAQDFADADWQEMLTPGAWEDNGLLIDGSVWFRRALTLPESWHGRDLELSLGIVDDFDTTYFNGEVVGFTGTETSNAYLVRRNYRIPGRLVTGPLAVLAVRIFDQRGGGGFMGPPSAMSLRCPSSGTEESIALAGSWKYQVEWAVDRSSPLGQRHHWPSTLYNAMIHPLAAVPVRGILWYQGESNRQRAANYAELFPLLIRLWRGLWADDSLPFYFVQVAGFRCPGTQPRDDEWAELRESQNAALHQPNTGIAITIDIGDEADIHPRNKREVGRRLALIALEKTYRHDTVSSGPFPVGYAIENGIFRITFREAHGGLRTSDGGPLLGFAIAGEDHRFAWADAEILNTSEIAVHSKAIPRPVAVRYAWDCNPRTNLVNGAGLPATPFRTDDWPLITAGRSWPD